MAFYHRAQDVVLQNLLSELQLIELRGPEVKEGENEAEYSPSYGEYQMASSPNLWGSIMLQMQESMMTASRVIGDTLAVAQPVFQLLGDFHARRLVDRSFESYVTARTERRNRPVAKG